jgi:hypothetical protein
MSDDNQNLLELDLSDDDNTADDLEEESEDEGLATDADSYEAILHPTDWTVDTIVDQVSQGVIDINPNFQRRDAWDVKRKSLFIESLLLGLPVPQLILADDPKRKGRFVVLDGKQRLLALLQFTRTKPYEEHELRLTGLEVLNDLVGGLTLGQIKEIPALEDRLFQFHTRTIRCVVIRKWKSTDLLYKVFERLNTGSVKLSPQELRQALFPGEFTVFVDQASAKCAPLHHVMGRKDADPRMKDAEILLRHLAFSKRMIAYQGSLKDFLDDTCEIYNGLWPNLKDELQHDVDEYGRAVSAASEIFGRTVARKYVGNQFGKRFNRAVLEIMTYYLRHEDVRKNALAVPEKVVDAFITLSKKESDFTRAFEVTTKTNTAVYNRFAPWGEALQSTLGIPIPGIPKLDDGSLVL